LKALQTNDAIASGTEIARFAKRTQSIEPTTSPTENLPTNNVINQIDQQRR
jgi:hypothetical protein